MNLSWASVAAPSQGETVSCQANIVSQWWIMRRCPHPRLGRKNITQLTQRAPFYVWITWNQLNMTQLSVSSAMSEGKPKGWCPVATPCLLVLLLALPGSQGWTLESDQLWYLSSSFSNWQPVFAQRIVHFPYGKSTMWGISFRIYHFVAHIFRWGSPRQIQDVASEFQLLLTFPFLPSPVAWPRPPRDCQEPYRSTLTVSTATVCELLQISKAGSFWAIFWGAIRRVGGLWMFMGLCLWNWVFAGKRKGIEFIGHTSSIYFI